MITTVPMKGALLDGAREVFETMVFTTLEDSPDEPAGLDEGLPRTRTGVGDPECLLGSITFKGQLEGCLGIRCDESCARTIAGNMLGMASTDELSDNDVSDAIGEITNMVMGAVKSRIQDEVGAIEVSIPSVVQGRELKSSLSEGSALAKVRVSIEEQYNVEFTLLYRQGSR